MKILLLGGSKFMGLDLLEKLLQNDDIEIYIINRGKIHWNGYFYNLIHERKNVFHYICDRDDSSEFKNTILNIINFSKSKSINDKSKGFDFVIDFSCFNKDDAKDLLKIIKNEFFIYIFISTDSTYNVSEVGVKRNNEFFYENDKNNILLVEENEAKLLNDKNVRRKYKKIDSYGYNKLKAENYIKDFFSDCTSCYYLILRLPDVIGTYDESFRIWYYIEWIKNCDISPLELEKIDTARPLSFVLKEDVTDLIIRVVKNAENYLEGQVLNQEYNIAFEENLNLMDFVQIIGKFLNKEPKFKILEQAKTYYPSVSFGPLSIQKAKKLLNFKPSSIEKAIEKSVEFFETNGNCFEKERKKMIRDLPKKIRKCLENSDQNIK